MVTIFRWHFHVAHDQGIQWGIEVADSVVIWTSGLEFTQAFTVCRQYLRYVVRKDSVLHQSRGRCRTGVSGGWPACDREPKCQTPKLTSRWLSRLVTQFTCHQLGPGGVLVESPPASVHGRQE